ncbi:uncharacterized protein LOC143764903 [Ranitomeya variabilis]|uniref:uncharacterized protein LOC143764903 n=1 Tax=Ranitomeya variabilis TaxID=490064 RepID=UPI004057A8D8
MDMKARETLWRTKASDIFKTSISGVFNDIVCTHKDLIRQYKNLLIRKTKIWWTKTSLDKYVELKIIPRGLRVQLFPTFDLNNDDLLRKWIEAANTCSITFMQIIIEHNNLSLKKLDEEIDSLLATIQKEIQGDALSRCLQDIEKELEKCEKNISDGKKRKFARDVGDFEMKKIFRWQNVDRNSKLPPARSESMSSLASSVGAQGSASDREMPSRSGPTTRFRNQKKTFQTSKNYRRERDADRDRNKVINLSTHILTTPQIEVLEKGLTFSPSCSLDPFLAIKDIHLFARKIILKKFHHRNVLLDGPNMEEEQETLDILLSLAEENENPPEFFCRIEFALFNCEEYVYLIVRDTVYRM